MIQNDKNFNATLLVLQLAKQEGINDIDYTALVKYVYLLDCFYAEINNGQKYTELKWQFLNFGPFAAEMQDFIPLAKKDSRLFIKQFNKYDMERDSSRIGYKGWNNQVIIDLSSYVTSKLKELIKEYASKDLNELLHYIYFKTNPMIEAKPSEILSFKNCKKIVYKEVFGAIKEKQVSKKLADDVFSFLDTISIKNEIDDEDSVWYDELYYKNIESAKPIYESSTTDLNQEDFLLNLSGKAKIKYD
jgi:hypothetical protein